MNELAKVILKSGKDISLRRFHPWVFSGAIKKIIGHAEEGDLVRVVDNKDEFLAIGHYQIGSIAVRAISFVDEMPSADFYERKISNAYEMRKIIGVAGVDNNDTYRLVHAEGDGMPGLIIDVYNGTAVMQMHSIGMWHARNEIAQAIKNVLGDEIKAVYDKSETTLPFKADITPLDGCLLGKSESFVATECGLKFNVDWVKGQKTGFFIDQRDNRNLLESYSKGKKVLNMFCYTGGFSFYAMRGGADLVHSVDSSGKAIDLTRQNVELNYPEDSRHEAYAVDAFKFMDEMTTDYDVIVLDPPAFAKHKNVLNNALKGYKRLNMKAFEKIKPGGIVFTFSCSQVVTRDLFRKAIFSAAAQSGRNVKILHQLTQPADHPVSIYHPEGEYLKGLVLYVE